MCQRLGGTQRVVAVFERHMSKEKICQHLQHLHADVIFFYPGKENYFKENDIPKDWTKDPVFLHFLELVQKLHPGKTYKEVLPHNMKDPVLFSYLLLIFKKLYPGKKYILFTHDQGFEGQVRNHPEKKAMKVFSFPQLAESEVLAEKIEEKIRPFL